MPHHQGHFHHNLHAPRDLFPAMRARIGTPTVELNEPPSIVERQFDSTSSPSSSSTSSSSAMSMDSSSNSNKITIAIALSVVIPLTVILCVFYWLYRRNKKRVKHEDAQYKHGSLDFGLGEVSRRAKREKKGKRLPEMIITPVLDEKALRKDRGISIDMGSPYIVPSETVSGRASFQDGEDPYRPVTMVRSHADSNGSGASTLFPLRPGSRGNDSTRNLLSTSQSPVSATDTAFTLSPFPSNPSEHAPLDMFPSSNNVTRKPVGTTTIMEEEIKETKEFEIPKIHEYDTDSNSNSNQNSSGLRSSSSRTSDGLHQTNFAFDENRSSEQQGHLSVQQRRSSFMPPRSSSRITKTTSQLEPFDEYATYADVLGIVQKETADLPTFEETPADDDSAYMNTIPEHQSTGGLGVHFAVDERRLSASIRPLPPDDPADSAEQRANRIRSFYREYFDDKAGNRATLMDGAADYYEDYGQEYLNGVTIWDPETGQFVVTDAPYAQPITRRAMTPPPRAPPRFRPGGQRSASGSGGPGFVPGRGVRAHSSASARPPMGAGPRGRPQKKLPPPSPLTNVPTPHLLKDDVGLFNMMDFAPPTTFQGRAAGRSDSPLPEQRPYTPPVKTFTPLKSAFTDLAVMPSPHALRKSSTFTALDFAPPPGFKEMDSASDAGSVRSGRSNVSARQVANIRAGAYRLSRLPKEAVGTRDDFSAALKPTWQQRG